MLFLKLIWKISSLCGQMAACKEFLLSFTAQKIQWIGKNHQLFRWHLLPPRTLWLDCINSYAKFWQIMRERWNERHRCCGSLQTFFCSYVGKWCIKCTKNLLHSQHYYASTKKKNSNNSTCIMTMNPILMLQQTPIFHQMRDRSRVYILIPQSGHLVSFFS